MKRKKKDTVTYVDDGRTVADMSHVRGGFDWLRRGTSSTVGEIWRTYWSAVKMMFRPMLVVVGFLCTIFAIAAALLYLMP